MKVVHCLNQEIKVNDRFIYWSEKKTQTHYLHLQMAAMSGHQIECLHLEKPLKI